MLFVLGFDGAGVSMKPELISPFVFSCDGVMAGAWAYVLTGPVCFRVRGMKWLPREILCDGFDVGFIEGEMLTIYPGYAWNGMSCWPDSPTNILASLFHDFWYQVGGVITRKQADEGLRYLLEVKGDAHAGKCYYAVRACGWMFYGKTKGVTLVEV